MALAHQREGKCGNYENAFHGEAHEAVIFHFDFVFEFWNELTALQDCNFIFKQTS